MRSVDEGHERMGAILGALPGGVSLHGYIYALINWRSTTKEVGLISEDYFSESGKDHLSCILCIST